MKKLFFIMLCALAWIGSAAQIKSFSGAQPIVNKNEKKVTYDSTTNFVGENVEALLGQELYVIPQPEEWHKYGYTRFYHEYDNSKSDTYYIKKYELYAGKTFIVDSILPRPYDPRESWKKFPILKLREKTEGTIYYYLYKPELDIDFPFIIMGFYEKEKVRCVGKKLVVKKDKNPYAGYYEEAKVPLHDVITGLEIKVDPEDVWTIKELVVDQDRGAMCYMITNKKNETLNIKWTDINDYQRLTGPCVLRYDDNLKQIHEKQPEMYKRIMDGKVALGMTKDMVLMSWGNPQNMNSASFGDGWMYTSTGQFLYFVNGKLESFQ